MIEPLEIRATPNPLGNRIDLEWVHPDVEGYDGVRIVRRQGTYPRGPDDGELVVDLPLTGTGRQVYRWTDEGLDGETVFYYMFFPFAADPPEHPPDYQVDLGNRAAAIATSRYGYGARMTALLPAIYQRYDNDWKPSSELLEKLAEEDEEKGPLRRFVEIAGSHLDQLHSLARSVLDLHDLDQVDGRLLPLLASWIGWPTNHRIELREQRSELRKAPHIYRTIGLIPTIEATVKRILGWESRTKEFAHNVFLSNRPERLNLWLAERDASGTWSQPTAPLSLNYAYEGRPAAVHDGTGKLWLFFHTQRKRTKVSWSEGIGPEKSYRRGQWDIWYKTYDEDWAASRPLTDSPAVDKHPSAALEESPEGTRLWVFWDTWSESDCAWHIAYRTLEQGAWSARQRLWDDANERRCPQAVADDQGKLWLFWQERGDAGWEVRYNRHDGSGWELEPADAGRLRGATEEDPRVEEDLFVLFDPRPRLWVFWARRATSTGRWRIAYRVKPDLDLAEDVWSDVLQLPTDVPEADDREPAAVIDKDGNPELYWSSNRDRSWSIWRATLDPESLASGPPEKLTANPFSQRAPLAVSAAGAAGTLLFYYSNQSLAYTSDRYRATRTVDGRYAGSTTADPRNAAKIALRGTYHDLQTYTFDTGAGGQRGDQNWYAHDTVGLYLTPSSNDPSVVVRGRDVLARVLRQFLPVQVRAVLIIEPAPYKEPVYTYDFDDADPQRVIGEMAFDATLPESYDGLGDDYTDIVPDWVWIYSWSAATPSHRSVDFAADPIDVSQRTWHVGLEPGG